MLDRHAVRLTGWVLAANALALLAAVALGGSVSEAARHAALFCGLRGF
jgi:hypothetical protein